jgi:hypothetical protein
MVTQRYKFHEVLQLPSKQAKIQQQRRKEHFAAAPPPPVSQVPADRSLASLVRPRGYRERRPALTSSRPPSRGNHNRRPNYKNGPSPSKCSSGRNIFTELQCSSPWREYGLKERTTTGFLATVMRVVLYSSSSRSKWPLPPLNLRHTWHLHSWFPTAHKCGGFTVSLCNNLVKIKQKTLVFDFHYPPLVYSYQLYYK